MALEVLLRAVAATRKPSVRCRQAQEVQGRSAGGSATVETRIDAKWDRCDCDHSDSDSWKDNESQQQTHNLAGLAVSRVDV